MPSEYLTIFAFQHVIFQLAKEQSRRPLDFLPGHAYQDGKREREHRGDFAQEGDLVCGICGAHGGYETAEKCVMFEELLLVGGAGCVGGQEKERVRGVFPGRRQSFPYQRRPVDDCSPGRGNDTRRRNKGRNVSWRNGSLQRKPALDYTIYYDGM